MPGEAGPGETSKNQARKQGIGNESDESLHGENTIMTDPYTEATRHERRGLPTFAKVILVGGGLFAAALVTAAVVGVIFARKAAEEWAEAAEEWAEADFETVETAPAEPFADVETLADLAEVLGAEAGVFARDSEGSGRNMERARRDLERAKNDLERARRDLDQLVISLQHPRDGGDIDIDIDLADIDEWVSELETLIEEAIEDGVRIEGHANVSGGRIALRRSNGRTIFELRGDEKGGVLKIHGPRRDTRVSLGNEADEIPEWVPVHPDARVHKHLFSGDSRKGSFGGVMLEADADARNIYDWYADNLAEAGLETSESRTHWDSRRKRGKIHARSDGLARERELVVLVRENERAGAGSLILVMHKVER